MKKLIKKINNFSYRYDLWQEGDKIVAGISGGPDSVCLLDMLVLLAKKKKFKLLMAHVNYGLRGEDSNEDEKFVKKLAEKYGLRCEVLNAQKKIKGNNGENGEGMPMVGPNLKSYDDDLVLAVLKDGKKGLLGHMPSFNERLNETQEKALASYIRSLGDK